jgi:hypothetical protein
MGGNLGLGTGFIEYKNVLKSCPVGAASLMGGYNFTKNIGLFLNLTYNYMWSKPSFGTDEFMFAVGGGISISLGK